MTEAGDVRISFAIPYYDNPGYLAEAVASVQAQTVYGWELVVVDDAGPEPAEDVVRRLGDPRGGGSAWTMPPRSQPRTSYGGSVTRGCATSATTRAWGCRATGTPACGTAGRRWRRCCTATTGSARRTPRRCWPPPTSVRTPRPSSP